MPMRRAGDSQGLQNRPPRIAKPAEQDETTVKPMP